MKKSKRFIVVLVAALGLSFFGGPKSEVQAMVVGVVAGVAAGTIVVGYGLVGAGALTIWGGFKIAKRIDDKLTEKRRIRWANSGDPIPERDEVFFRAKCFARSCQEELLWIGLSEKQQKAYKKKITSLIEKVLVARGNYKKDKYEKGLEQMDAFVKKLRGYNEEPVNVEPIDGPVCVKHSDNLGECNGYRGYLGVVLREVKLTMPERIREVELIEMELENPELREAEPREGSDEEESGEEDFMVSSDGEVITAMDFIDEVEKLTGKSFDAVDLDPQSPPAEG